MKQKRRTLIIAIIILIIVFINSIYVLCNSEKDITDTTLGFIILGLFIITIISAIFIVKIYKTKEIKPEKALLIIMPIFCILLSIVMPVGRGHDEYIHWLKAFEISEGTLITPIKAQNGIAVAELPYRSSECNSTARCKYI